MKRAGLHQLKTAKLSELSEIAKAKQIGLIYCWDKDGKIALIEQATHIRFSENPKKFMSRFKILYSGESVAMNPKSFVSDRDEISYVEWDEI